MKRLADFRDEKGLEVAAALMEQFAGIVSNPNVRAGLNDTQNNVQAAAVLLKNSPVEIRAVLAILDEKDPKEYHYTAGTVFAGVIAMLSDPDILELFGWRNQIPASSGSASENIEAPAT